MIDFYQIGIGSGGVRRLGQRADTAILVDPNDTQSCIVAGMRVFEAPFLPDVLMMTSEPSASSLRNVLQEIAHIQEVAEQQGVSVFIAALISVSSRTAPYFLEMVQYAINAGVDAIRIECTAPRHLINKASLAAAHDAATQAGIAFFGDGCEDYLNGAQLYTVITQQDEGNSDG